MIDGFPGGVDQRELRPGFGKGLVRCVGFDQQPGVPVDMVCLVVMSIANADAPTVNLLAPMVLNPRTGRAVQSVRDDNVYLCRQPLVGAPEQAPC